MKIRTLWPMNSFLRRGVKIPTGTTGRLVRVVSGELGHEYAVLLVQFDLVIGKDRWSESYEMQGFQIEVMS